MEGKLSRTSPVLWLVPAGMIAYPVLKFGGGQPGNLLVGSGMATAALFLGIFLFYGIPTLIYRGSVLPVILGAVIAIAVGLTVSGGTRLAISLGDPVILFVAGGVTGQFTRKGQGALKVYLSGLTVVIGLSVITYMSLWPTMMTATNEMVTEFLKATRVYLRGGGLEPSQIEEMMLWLKGKADFFVRVIPASMVMSAVIQYSVGFLLFFVRAVDDPVRSGKVKAFTRWKMPFEFAIVVIVAGLMRLFGGDTLTVIADNVILILAIYYCLCGLSLIEYVLKRIKAPLGLRILFYLFLFLTRWVGFVVAVFLGFIDSFADWRKLSTADFDLKKNVT